MRRFVPAFPLTARELVNEVIELPWLVIFPSAVVTRLESEFKAVASAFWARVALMFVTLLLSVTILFDAEVKRPSMFVTFEVKSVTADE
ncbi:hypothetical protein XB81_09225, partial [Acinetobacter baumannii]|nr:hypothetical protein [Acinetobacter baumannii]